MARKKIVFVLPNFQMGGAERVTVVLANHIDPERFEAHLIVLDGQGPLKGQVEGHVKLHDLEMRRSRFALGFLFKTLKTIRPNVIFGSHVHINAMILVCRSAALKARRIIRESGTPAVLIKEFGWKGFLCRGIYQFLYKSADVVICPAEHIAQDLRLWGVPSDRQIILHNPIELNRIREKAADFKGGGKRMPADKRVFVAVGRLNHEKGFDQLIEALGAFTPGWDWQLDIWGEGEERPLLETLIVQHNLQKHVSLRGHTDNPWAHMARADALLLPSRSEGMPNAALEALACGTPVIALARAGGIKDIAAESPAEAVQIAKDFKSFIANMAQQKPLKEALRPSMLPASFREEIVLKRFEALLEA